ncbi:glycosyltransferase [Clostridium perfringens]|uniref:glycosyltransferase n=1 Tax=Clostridium perfringens TaxID=1502 RepID=UPI001A1E3FA9|nr:glycosyltransferase [Clostridium perfringens]MDH5087655.1 N-glycosyltransferase [Clostridium perfringens]HAT4227604.1 glycosyltransferase family 2 protein [Clostridium perfringens]HBI7034454.1 glycosyltransferase family 2 protein [Clostridium perfringens]HBI7048254.1 glycosyltransferase family 2 protein [Clostridium perfringens]HBI7053391.1 glycosyltransferase family 2 protein [Clostridium perfringens]
MINVLVVLNYNDYLTTKNFIEKIKQYSNLEKIIIVDNNSTDNSYELLMKLKSSKIEVIKCPKNNGYASGNNFGIKYAEYKFNPKYVIISNPDVYFDEEVINEIENIMETNPKYAMGTCTMKEKEKTRNLNAYKTSNYKHNLITILPILGRIYNNKFIKYDEDYFKREYSEVEVIPGSFFIARLDYLKKVNYFSEETFLYCEEEILGYKLKNNNLTSIILNNREYKHSHSISINKNIKRNVDKHKILHNSREVYIKNYLQVNKFKLHIFKCLSYLTIKERYIIEFLKAKV